MNRALAAYSACITVALVATLLRRKQKNIASKTVEKIEPSNKEDKALVESCIRIHQDFPIKGILFRDIFPVFRNAAATQALMRLLVEKARTFGKVDMVVGLESRGFLIGPTLAMELGCGFAPVRKPGKLPGKLVSASYEKEYGKDTFEMQADAIAPGDRVLIVDDLLATGGSLFATIQLIESLKAQVVHCMVVIELKDLNGHAKLKAPMWSVFQF